MAYVYITINEDPELFIKMFGEVALNLGYDIGKPDKIFEFIKLSIISPDGNNGQLLYESKRAGKIRVEVFSSGKMNYETYVDSCRSMYLPIVKAYNKKYKARLSIRKEAQDAHRLKLPPKSDSALQKLLLVAGKPIFYPPDWQRFYTFIRICHQTRVKFTPDQLKDVLIKNGYSNAYAEYVADVGMHLLSFLKGS